ncbi:MAG: hypothetical protein AMXMBFR84_45240 [Candidatus Hydrogenedentota bacterium]
MSEHDTSSKPTLPATIRVAACGLLLGTLADQLLRVGPWGLNASIWFLTLACCLVFLLGKCHPAIAWDRWSRVAAVGGFGLLILWRDSDVLKALNVLAILVACIQLLISPFTQRLRDSSFLKHFVAAVEAGIGGAAGMPLLLAKDIPESYSRITEHENRPSMDLWIRLGWSSGLGLLITVPLLFVFGRLFMTADALFSHYVTHLLDLDWHDLATHILVTALCTWLIGGYLRAVAIGHVIPEEELRRADAVRSEAPTVLIPLVSLVLLFASFLLTQLPRFLGGDALIQAKTGVTYAEYAREGFFQLVAASALALPLLFTADWLMREASVTLRRIQRRLSIVWIMLIYLLMASALHRMFLYTEAYGLTELRLYTTVFMVWLALLFVWYFATVHREKRDRFVPGSIVTGFVFVLLLNLANPDAFIVRHNLARLEAGKVFDSKYNLQLSADSIPVLAEVLAQDREYSDWFAHWMGKNSLTDWRSWGIARHIAVRTLKAHGIESAPETP